MSYFSGPCSNFIVLQDLELVLRLSRDFLIVQADLNLLFFINVNTLFHCERPLTVYLVQANIAITAFFRTLIP